jgi:hypothetical protein
MDMDYIKILGTIVTAVLGWVIGHYFTTKRDVSLKRREISLGHLINAYRILTNDISHRPETKEGNEKLETILSDIQLFGTEKQVQLSKELIDVVASGGEFPLDPLINDLRDDLRKQIGLSEIEGNVKWLRFKKKS